MHRAPVHEDGVRKFAPSLDGTTALDSPDIPALAQRSARCPKHAGGIKRKSHRRCRNLRECGGRARRRIVAIDAIVRIDSDESHNPKVAGSNPAPATIDDEGLADAKAASPFRLPRPHPGIGFRFHPGSSGGPPFDQWRRPGAWWCRGCGCQPSASQRSRWHTRLNRALANRRRRHGGSRAPPRCARARGSQGRWRHGHNGVGPQTFQFSDRFASSHDI